MEVDMRVGVLLAAAAALAISLGTIAQPVRASVTVMGGGLAETCSKAARSASRGSIIDQQAIKTCSLSLDTENLSLRDKAGTYINRGVLLLTRSDFRGARKDFDTALYFIPNLGEAYVNRGAALIGEHRFAEGIVEIDKGLALGPEEPEKAYSIAGWRMSFSTTSRAPIWIIAGHPS
jgi:tetratricopeptide (TPR) repeat protein